MTTRTIGDGLRTQSLGALNFEHVLRYVDGIVAVSEDEIFAAMRLMLTVTKLVPEPSGAVTLAAALFHAEEMGLDSAVVSDHFLPWRYEGGHAPSALAWITAVGERTSRIQLGTSVLTPSFRYHPGVVAQAFATLGSMFPDRIVLGVGTGEALNEVALGITWPDQKERFARLKEAIGLIEQLWTEDRVTLDGEHWQMPERRVQPKPESRRELLSPVAMHTP